MRIRMRSLLEGTSEVGWTWGTGVTGGEGIFSQPQGKLDQLDRNYALYLLLRLSLRNLQNFTKFYIELEGKVR